MFRAAALSLALLIPNLSHALCSGTGIEPLLSTAQRDDLAARVAATPFGTGLYWGAVKGDTTLSIMGTMHLPDTRHDALLNTTLDGLMMADLLLVEATLQDQTAMQVYVSQNPDLLAITTGPTLPELLSDAEWAVIRDAASARGIPGFLAAKMQPWFLAMTLAIPPCASTAIMSGQTGLDGMLMANAARAGVPVQALEPWQDMLTLLSSGSFDEQIDALKLGLVSPDIQDALIATLTSAYFAEETAYSWHINSYLIDFLPDIDPAEFNAQMAEMEADLLDARNRNWIPVINDAAAKHDHVFIAFGAAHLIGEFGVLNLLQNDGWTITRR